ncbi:MAG TPA: lytic transglycosylase domain-containing protein, partial [Allosphingosinicella sp.]
MQKKALFLSLLGVSAVSAAAVATGVRPVHVARMLPAAVQGAMTPLPPPAQPRPAPAYAPVQSAVAADLARWNSLRQTDSLPFSSYASFLISHRGWPGETAMRRTAEKANSDGGAAFEVIGFFSAFPPLTPAGHARHAFALQASGRGNEALEAARKAWTGGVLPATDEARILSQFGGRLSSADHDARLEALLGNGDTQSAARTLPLASAQRQALYSTRLALQTKASDAASRLAALGPVEGDPGLLVDRANWLRNSGQSLAARQLMAQPRRLTRPPANAEKWFEAMMTLAKGAANDAQWSTAYQIASQLDDAYPAGTDVSIRPYGERDEYTNLAWLAGTAANKLGRFADAARMFDRYGRAARSSQTRTKGFYWAARSAFNAGQKTQSDAWLEQAAASPDQFYGQLALERLGRRVTPPSPTLASPTSAERSAFMTRPIVQATKALGDMDRWSDQSLFVRAIAEQAETTGDRVLAAQF